MKVCRFVFTLFSLATIGFTSFTLNAEEIKWHGFVSQGAIRSSGSNFIEDEGDLSAKLTEVGLNASYRVNSKLRVAAQGVYLNGGNRYPEGPRIDYLFLDWQAINSLDWQVNLHFGRYKNYHWLYSATRDVPHTRPSIILPQSVYFDAFRDVALGSDGIAIVSSTNNRLGDWEVNWSYGASPVSAEQTRNLFGPIANGDLDQDYVQQFTVFWQPAVSNFRFSMSLLDSDFTYRAGENDIYQDGEATSQRFMLSARYNQENWEATFEFLRERAIYSGLLFSDFNSDQTGEAAYIQTRYFLSRDITLLARLDLFDLDRKDRNGSKRSAQSGGNIPNYFGFQDQATLGVTWKFANQWQLQTEFHRVKGAARLAPVLIPNVQINNNKYWNIWALQLMHWF